MPDYDAVVREVYGDESALWREAYRPYRPVVKRKPKAKLAGKPLRKTVVKYHVTADARVKCECGVYVYTERIDNAPPVLPANCWRCGKAVKRR